MISSRHNKIKISLVIKAFHQIKPELPYSAHPLGVVSYAAIDVITVQVHWYNSTSFPYSFIIFTRS